MIEEEKALIWLCTRTGLDYRERAALLSAAKSPAALLHDWEKIFPAVIKNPKKGLYKNDRSSREREADEEISRLEAQGRFAITLLSDDYPECLKATPLPPFVLFGEGDRDLLQKRKFCVVGSRSIPAWAEKTGKRITEELTHKFVIVTGLAEGGDAAAIAGALPSGKLICVLPCGLDLCYPAAHASLKEKVRRMGLLLSEYPAKAAVTKYAFHERNRILAGLSEGVLVLSAGKRSGTLITARNALDCGREVFALPHNAGAAQGEGCSELIKNGAYLTTEAQDILTCFGMELQTRAQVTLTDTEKMMLSVLQEAGEAHVSELAKACGMQIYEAAATLSSLEMKELAAKAGGNRYSAV